ncbi:M23 family metallopeptidase [Nannocystis punicea]|uniref:M23 family metallopeptidase n=1 Tax=Nannocystis punicea TaxID=2995304 RepID=A0ABY7HET6_9BACT|nr:M23 family metallopeptidase [Nannocystis poenicansa]WAS97799.1 M23 family metallopeptidase [Nannocystis poenicansa]
MALSSGLFVACDEDEAVLTEDAVPVLAGAPLEDDADDHDGPPIDTQDIVHVEGADDGPEVFVGVSGLGQAEVLVEGRSGEVALVASELDPEVLRAHGAEPMLDFKIADKPVAGTISSPSGYGHYCSMLYPSGVSVLGWDAAGNDPCAVIIANNGAGGTIQRAGMMSAAGANQVVTRCDGNVAFAARGLGTGPLSTNWNNSTGLNGCIHTVSPLALPIFEIGPLPTTATVDPGTGVDFARPPITTLDTSMFGWGGSLTYGSSSAQLVDFKGRRRQTLTWIDDHSAYDLGVARGTETYALANGNVIASRWLDTKCTGSDGPVQGEVYIRHTVARNPSTYNETFVAAYFHLEYLFPRAPGADVFAGDILGHTGNMGCSTGPHLHFAVIRETNVADARSFTLQVPFGVGNNGYPYTIDPWGWQAPTGVDPWGSRASSGGAFSVNLWKPGAAPDTDTWED